MIMMMMLQKVLSCLCLALMIYVSVTNGNVIQVKNDNELRNALKSVNPGDTIQMADGEYSAYNGVFQTTRSGTPDHPITLQGSRKAMIRSDSFGLHLNGSSYWILRGFTIYKTTRGLMLDSANNNIIDNIEVYDIQNEGIHFRTSSTNNVLQNSYIHHTGQNQADFGQAIFIGSELYCWLPGNPDRSDHNKILNNTIGPNVAAQLIDIREGSCCGLISGNHFDGTGMAGLDYADSLIDLKGDNYTIENNVGTHSIDAGIHVHNIKKAAKKLKNLKNQHLLGGCNNIIRNNKCSDIKGKCVQVDIEHDTVFTANDCHNEVKE